MSHSAATGGPKIAVLVGLPVSVRSRLEQKFKGRLVLKIVPMKRDGGYLLEPPPREAARLIEQFSDLASEYETLTVVLLPYTKIPPEVDEIARLLESFGATVLRPRSMAGNWPAQPPAFDNKFQAALLDALAEELEGQLPPDDIDAEDEIVGEILRGLVTHSKMGPNNHSHEDDLWKSRGRDLGPGAKAKIVRTLLGEGILDRKKNDSKGGKGWVYWIDDVAKARARCPALDAYFE